MGFDSGMDEMHCHCPFQNCIAHFYTTPPKIVFIALQSWSSRYVILFLNLVSKHSPQQCSDPSILKKGRCDSILAWIKCTTTALFKTVLHFFIQHPQFFFIALQSWSSRHVIQFLNLVSKHSPHQCSDPSVLTKGRWDSILAWMKCSATALFKTVLHFFYTTPQIFFIALQS